jgi:hypothetical protein
MILHKAVVFEALAKSAQTVQHRVRGPLSKNPITGMAGCCARAASGHAAAPSSSVVQWRGVGLPK